MSHTNDRYRAAVQAHLEIVRKHHQAQLVEDRMYVRYAYTYGYTVHEIAKAAELTVPYVRGLLLDA